MELWNVKNLSQPPINSFKAPLKEVEVRLMTTSLMKALRIFEDQRQLSIEAALLSRTVYRLKTKFRSSKDFKCAEKLNHALTIYLQIQITRPLKMLLNSVPKKYTMSETYLPTKHMVDFVLVRLQSLGKLLVRIIDSCKITCELMQQRLRLGHFWKLALITYAIASRVYIISKVLIKCTCELYQDLLPLESKLSNIGNQWLPHGYVLPENLSQWLDLDWMDIERTIIEIEDDENPITSYMNLLDDDSDDDVEIFDEYVLIKDDSEIFRETGKSEDSQEENEGTDHLAGFDEDVDVGEEVISLSDSEPSPSKKDLLSQRSKRKRARKLKYKKRIKQMKKQQKREC